MNDKQKLSRRDWFRLKRTDDTADKKTPISKTLGKGAVKNSGGEKCSSTGKSIDRCSDEPALKEISHPPNHDGMDLSQLPPMREACLSDEQVQSLFSDIQLLGSNIQLMQRTFGSQRAHAAEVESAEQLRIAKSELLNGRIARVQIRYRWQDSLWIDTLAKQDEGYRLVRISHDS